MNLGVVAIEKGAFGSPSTTSNNYIFHVLQRFFELPFLLAYNYLLAHDI